MPPDRTVAVTGAAGFIGRNLVIRLRETGLRVLPLTRQTPPDEAERMIAAADVVFHLAAAIRPSDPVQFAHTVAYTRQLAGMIGRGDRRPLVIISSSNRAGDDSDYGRSKRAIEDTLLDLSRTGQATIAICRLPGVFGKWARPNYNSVVATFCHNLANGLPIRVDDPATPLTLLYVDDLIDQWRALMASPPPQSGLVEIGALHQTTVGEVERLIRGFADGRASGRIGCVGSGLERALYATFVAALPTEAFSYPLVAHTDARGSFTEMIKTPASGQLSYFTAHPGVTRGGHYHHSKVEKFLIVQGEALFRFRHIVSGDAHEIRTSAERPTVVETVPGWTHDVTNVGDGMMVSVIWANEVFNRERPDTVAMTL
jgi:UDP-2-acetamido-2,6-beta-L-arabino-hexul-4-ose reductase